MFKHNGSVEQGDAPPWQRARYAVLDHVVVSGDAGDVVVPQKLLSLLTRLMKSYQCLGLRCSVHCEF